MAGARTPLSVWLQPAEPARATFEAIIDGLARQHGAPRFAPHITLSAGTAELGAFRDELAVLARTAQPLRVRVLGSFETAELFKTVCLRIELSPALQALQRAVQALLPDPDAYRFDPHLSLIYQQLPAATRQHIAQHVHAPESFECDVLATVVPSDHGWSAVDGWQIIQHCRLGT